MTDNHHFDVIIIGGSYAGLSAAMALGRSLRKVLIIDSGRSCNRQTPHSHNFITQDGAVPADISASARRQVMQYSTVTWFDGLAAEGVKTPYGYSITTSTGEVFETKKLVFATGIEDIMPDIPGFAECWGITVIHCPYCHGYEVKGEKTAILANGQQAYHYAQLLRNLTSDLTIFTNGPSMLTDEQQQILERHNIPLIEKEIESLKHESGHLRQIVFKDQSTFDVPVIYFKPDFRQHCDIPAHLGCELTEQGFIKVDFMQKTTLEGVYACGDATSPMRAVANAVAAGNLAGAMVNHTLCEEEFVKE